MKKIYVSKSKKGYLMPIIQNQDNYDINYRKEGEGYPIILLHALFSDLNMWYGGIAEELAKNFKVIAIDIRGFGKSSKPYNQDEYDINDLVQDVLAVIENEQIQEACVFGYSMGGKIAYKCVENHPKIFTYGIVGGMNLYDMPELKEGLELYLALLQNGIENFLHELESQFGPLNESDKDEILRNDPKAVSAFIARFLTLKPYSDDQIKNISVPLFLFAGEKDAHAKYMNKMTSVLSNATFFEVPGATHDDAFKANSVLIKISEFLQKEIR